MDHCTNRERAAQVPGNSAKVACWVSGAKGIFIMQTNFRALLHFVSLDCILHAS